MRIQNNITAMNTHRMYTINNDNVAKSAEKLSSGYRINRAGDDAAGLAISEKMRSQIRGLNMATKNSQDAISLVQTAEGALQETQNMLQRMNELAVQAATGTNQEIDRTALSKEFEQLKREINDVAEQTTFNNMKILDGSLSYRGYQRSAETSGVTNTITDSGKVVAEGNSAAAGGAFVGNVLSDGLTADATGQQGKLGITAPAAMDHTLKTGQVATIELTDDRGDKHQFKFTATADIKLDAAGWGTLLGSAFAASNTSGANADNAYKDLNGSNNATIAYDTTNKQFTITAAQATATDLSKWTATIDVQHGGPAIDLTPKVDAEHKRVVNTATSASGLLTVDDTQAKVGDTITIGNKTYEIIDGTAAGAATNGATLANGNTAVQWNKQTGDSSNVVTILNAAIGTTDTTGTAKSAGVIGGKVIQLQAFTAGAGKTSEVTVTAGGAKGADGDGNKYEGRQNTIEFDVAKMKEGDKFTFTISGEDSPVEVTYDGKMDRAQFMEYVKGQFADISNAEQKGNAVIIKDADVKIELDSAWEKEAYAVGTNAMRIQVGALENEQLNISIDAMNTKGLDLDDSFLTKAGNTTDQNIDLAGKAITATRDAVNKVSDMRATLGAMQNRLDHKIANLKVSSENLSAAESRIRDVDMAQEMTNFTKNNILSQAATAMLAQANALPQNVLSLLG